MKNWEKYEKEIREFGLTFAVLKGSNEVVGCSIKSPFGCEECLFYEDNSCGKGRSKWLYSDYKEPVVLTEDERKLCELLGKGWIARDRDGIVYHYSGKPIKSERKNKWEGWCVLKISRAFQQCKFDFIKWEDEEPWEVKI